MSAAEATTASAPPPSVEPVPGLGELLGWALPLPPLPLPPPLLLLLPSPPACGPPPRMDAAADGPNEEEEEEEEEEVAAARECSAADCRARSASMADVERCVCAPSPPPLEADPLPLLPGRSVSAPVPRPPVCLTGLPV